MRVSTRELGLLWMAAAVVISWLSYRWIDPRMKALGEREDSLVQMERDRLLAERKISRKGEYEERLAAFRGQLPSHSPDARVTADLLRMIENTAHDSNLVLLKREPEDERSLGEIYEVSIKCTWEGNLDALVRFLYTIQTQGAILDIRFLTVSPKSGEAEMLRGSFTVDCAYSREVTTQNTEPNNPGTP